MLIDEAFFGTFLFFLSFLNPKMGISKPQIFLVMQLVKTLVFKRKKKKAAIANRYNLSKKQVWFTIFLLLWCSKLATSGNVFSKSKQAFIQNFELWQIFKFYENFVKLQWENIKENVQDLGKRKRRKNGIDPHLQNQGSTKNHLRKSRKNQRNPKIPCHRLTI